MRGGATPAANPADSDSLRALVANVPLLDVERVELHPNVKLEGISAITADQAGNIYVIHRPTDLNADPVVVLEWQSAQKLWDHPRLGLQVTADEDDSINPDYVEAVRYMTRGLVLLHADNRPFTDDREIDKFIMLAQHLKTHVPSKITALLLPHGKTLESYKKHCNNKYTCVVCKRMMLRYAEAIAQKE